MAVNACRRTARDKKHNDSALLLGEDQQSSQHSLLLPAMSRYTTRSVTLHLSRPIKTES